MELIFFLTFIATFGSSQAIWCYQCHAGIPGCTEDFNWRGMGYLGTPCPDSEDICIKLIERKGAEEVITRDCLSNFRAFRTDIPADTYEGCRPAAKDQNLAHYVNNSIKELDLKRDYYDETTWCFCFLDHRCNSASFSSTSIVLLLTLRRGSVAMAAARRRRRIANSGLHKIPTAPALVFIYCAKNFIVGLFRFREILLKLSTKVSVPQKASGTNWIITIFKNIRNFLMIALLSLTAELYCKEFDETKKIASQIMDCYKEKNKVYKHVNTMLWLIEETPPDFVFFGVFKLDGTLPFKYITEFFTYAVILIQFTFL